MSYGRQVQLRCLGRRRGQEPKSLPQAPARLRRLGRGSRGGRLGEAEGAGGPKGRCGLADAGQGAVNGVLRADEQIRDVAC
jgi:hypothetical protein